MAASEGPRGLDGLVTESRRADGDYSALTTLELVELMNREDATVPLAVGAEAAPLAAALDEIVARLSGGGRLVYAGAGRPGASPSWTRRNARARSGPVPARSSRSSPAPTPLPARSARPPRTTLRPAGAQSRALASRRPTPSSASARAAAPPTQSARSRPPPRPAR